METDGPYLSPEPVRKIKTCEPAFVRYTLEVVATAKAKTLAEMDAITTANTRAFYNWRA